MFTCQICHFSTESPLRYSSHFRAHSAFQCGLEGCSRYFSKLTTFKCHLSRDHAVGRRKQTSASLQNVGIVIKCNVASCQKPVIPLSNLGKHFKQHISAGITITYPANGYCRKMSKVTTFTAHLSVKHGTLNKLSVDQSMLDSSISSSSDVRYCDVISDSEIACDDSISESSCNIDIVDTNNFVYNLTLMLLKLQSRYNIASSTVDVLAEEFKNMHMLGMENSMKQTHSKLVTE